VAGSVRSLLTLRGGPDTLASLGELLFSVTTRKPSFEKLCGSEMFPPTCAVIGAWLINRRRAPQSGAALAIIIGLYEDEALDCLVSDSDGDRRVLLL
jgi:hypothetical protein